MKGEARLNLNDLGSASIPGVSARLGAALAEAAGVCLESQGHAQGVELRVSGYVSGVYSVDWHPISDRSRRAWNDPDEATEYGAAGVAVLLIERETGYSVIQRSDKGTGVDYTDLETLPTPSIGSRRAWKCREFAPAIREERGRG